MPDFGELKSVDIRVLWPHEARDFTPWLTENINLLSDALGMELEVTARETDVGNFSLDLLAKDLGSGCPVVIESQFGATNRDHLGKVITYAAGVDATAVVWGTESVRDEHRQVLEWLNRRTDAEIRFFVVVVEVVRIDESRPAVLFKPVVSPNEWQRVTRETAERQASPRGEAYLTLRFASTNSVRSTVSLGPDRPATELVLILVGRVWRELRHRICSRRRVRAEIYIDQDDAETSKVLFDTLLAQKVDIEREFREPLVWERLDDRRASRIAVYREGNIIQSEEELAEIRGLGDRASATTQAGSWPEACTGSKWCC